MINGLFSKRYSVLSVIPQGSILGTLLYLVCVNDLPEICDSNGNESQMYQCADYAKVYKKIKNETDCNILQQDILITSKLGRYMVIALKLNITKRRAYGKIVSYAKRSMIEN